MDQIQKLVQQFNLQTLSIDPSTQIHIFLLTSQQFYYHIIKKSQVTQTKKKKKYRIHFHPNFHIFKSHIITFINKFPIKKLRIQLATEDLYLKTEWDSLKQLTFNSIQIYQEGTQNFHHSSKNPEPNPSAINLKIFEQILKIDFNTEMIEIKLISCIKQIFLLQEILNTIEIQRIKLKQLNEKDQSNLIPDNNHQGRNHLHKPRYKFCFTLEDLNMEQIFRLIIFWCRLKNKFCYEFQPSVPYSQKYNKKQRLFSPEQLKKFEKSSSKIDKQTLRQLRDQAMVIEYGNERILSLNQSQIHGYSIVLGKYFMEYRMIHEMINVVLGSEYFISLQFECEMGHIVDALDLIVRKHNDHCNYLIKIGNHVEITSYRLMLNTTNLSSKIVTQILQLLLLPGHYQLIFYGTLEYFEPLKSIFLKKSFIKFNYLLPMPEVSVEVGRIISKMETLADLFRIKILQFCSLLNVFSYQKFNTIQSIFLSMHLTDPQDQAQNQKLK